MNPIISATGLTKKFGRTVAVDHIDLALLAHGVDLERRQAHVRDDKGGGIAPGAQYAGGVEWMIGVDSDHLYMTIIIEHGTHSQSQNRNHDPSPSVRWDSLRSSPQPRHFGRRNRCPACRAADRA